MSQTNPGNPLSGGRTKSEQTTKSARYRKEIRQTIQSEVGIDTGNGDWRMFPLTDLSPHGCNLNAADWPFRTGQFLSLRISRSGRLEGIIRWVRDGHIGIEFVRPLSNEIIEKMTSPD